MYAIVKQNVYFLTEDKLSRFVFLCFHILFDKAVHVLSEVCV